MHFGRILSPRERRKVHSSEIFAEKIVADAWRFRRAQQLVPALYQREEREAKLEAARREKSSCETSFLQELMES